MQQRSLNSHFKIKKNKLADGIFSSNEKVDLGLSEKKKNDVSEEKMKLAVQSSGIPTRAKRVPRDSGDSFEEPEIIGKRVKLEKKKSKKEDKKIEAENNNQILQSFKGSNGKVKNIFQSEENSKIIEKKALLDKISKISPNKQEDVVMSVGDHHLMTEKLTPSQSKSSAITNSNLPKPMDLSSKTKSIIESILKKKSESDSAKKTTETFNYLNYSSAILKTPVKTNNSVNNNIFGLSSNNNSFQKINNDFSINNSLIKNSTPITATPNKPAELKLSQRTLDVINQLKSERKNRFERESVTQERVRSESSFSLKFKYEDLVKEERELILPPHYKKLLQSFTELDLVLNFNKLGNRRNSVPVFEELKQSIESSYKHKFDFKTFLQLLYVTPHLYIYKWQKMNINSEDYSLIIDIPKDHQKRLRGETVYDGNTDCKKLQTEIYDPALQALSNAELEERKKVFKNALIAITNESHLKYLESIDFTRDYDAYKLKTWHHEFDLEKVAPIPIFEILEKPTIKITSIEEFLQNNDIKNSLIKRAIAGINTDEDEKLELRNTIDYEDTMSISTNRSADPHLSSLSKYLQPSLLKKIVAKEEAVNISNEFLHYSAVKAKERNKVKEYQSFVDKLKTIFIINNSPSICIDELISRLNHPSKWSFSEGNKSFNFFRSDENYYS